MLAGSASNSRSEVHEDARRMNLDFPVESYNPGRSSDLPSLPYKISLIVPQKVFADIYGFDPPNIREQLYCGCMAADQVMANGEIGQSQSGKFARLSRLQAERKISEANPYEPFQNAIVGVASFFPVRPSKWARGRSLPLRNQPGLQRIFRAYSRRDR